MTQTLIESLNLITIATLLAFPFLKTKGRGVLFLIALSVEAVLATIAAVSVFVQGAFSFEYPGSFITGPIPVRIDALSAWFMVTLAFTFLTGGWYGFHYLKKYKDQSANLALHAGAFLTAFTALIDVCSVQNGMVFLIVWEIMALCSFVIVIFDSQKKETIQAGINYLIQSHIGVLFLTIGVMWMRVRTGSFDLAGITAFSLNEPQLSALGLFLCFFIGFAFKAGFVPFHTWLPLAHPAAPAHVSGVMSGVIIKIGIYGILRVLLLIRTDMITLGYFIVTVSVLTGVYGVMLAIIQHNLKKLLAYHSIENIGIIGIGIGLGCLGLGYGNQMMAVCGFGGALLHTLNHSLFKSLLFYAAGNVYQARHTMDIEKLGGLIRKMPQTAWLFLLGSLAICGLPPFNGFVSEFFIYIGLFNGLPSHHFLYILFLLFAIVGLVLIGGLALICFTKAFGVIFLGTSRETIPAESYPEKPLSVIPLYVAGTAIVLIGVLPFLLTAPLQQAIGLYLPSTETFTQMRTGNVLSSLTVVGWCSLGFIALTAVLYGLRHLVSRRRESREYETWGCGYTGNAERMQYTASSYIRTFRKLVEPALLVRKEKQEAEGLYPEVIGQVTHPYDKMEKWLIDKPLHLFQKVLNRFTFLQNGNIQAYILYGVLFVGLVILLPLFFGGVEGLLNFLNGL